MNLLYQKTSRTQGFTILELLVVIALVGVILSIALASMSESRQQSENTTVLSQVNEYQKALQLHFTESGSYPGTPYDRTGILCLGDAAPLDCLDGRSSGVDVSSVDNSVAAANLGAVIAPYMPTQPHVLQPKGGHSFSSPAYSGCSDFINPNEPANTATRNCAAENYSIWFVLKGTNEDCGRATVADPQFESVYTLCRLQE